MVVITARPPAASWHNDVTRFIAVVESSPAPSAKWEYSAQTSHSPFCR